MVKITNGIDILEVSKGAFSDIYSRQGYRLVNEKSSKKSNDKEIDEEIDEEIIEQEIDEEEAAIFLESLALAPVSKWTKEDVKKYVQITGIDTSSANSFKEAKEIVKEHLESSKA